MELAKDIFLFLGSALGIVAFVQVLLQPSLDSNRTQWERLRDIASEEDFREVEVGSEVGLIDGTRLGRVSSLIAGIRDDAEFTQFGPILRARIRRHLSEMARIYDAYRDLVQFPEWEHPPDSRDWAFNKYAHLADQLHRRTPQLQGDTMNPELIAEALDSLEGAKQNYDAKREYGDESRQAVHKGECLVIAFKYFVELIREVPT